MGGLATPVVDPLRGIRSVPTPGEIDGVPVGGLSRFFEPFVTHFMREALRCGGEVWTSSDGSSVDGVYLYHPYENTASVFSRERGVAETLGSLRPHASVYSEFEPAFPSERYVVYTTDLVPEESRHQFRHRVRSARGSDLPGVLALMAEVYGRVDARWLESAPPEEETSFVVDGADEIAGVAWVTVVDGGARLHSLTVRPRYRRSGVATDLWHARVAFAREAGRPSAITEIAEENLASRSIAERGGMRAAGYIYLSRRP
jgi:GNAT superfamily N-acetyltransferase